MDVVEDAELHPEFNPHAEKKEGDKSTNLIPIIFSHGLFCTRFLYSSICRNLASHGFAVFAIEHTDSTAQHYYNNVTKEDIFY